MKSTQLVITERDFGRLNELIHLAHVGDLERTYVQALGQELDRCRIVASERVPKSVVTMGSRVQVRELRSKESEVYTLVYPGEANFEEGKLSVVAPLGSAILGARVGSVVNVRAPGGVRRVKIEKILYQPEAAGEVQPETAGSVAG